MTNVICNDIDYIWKVIVIKWITFENSHNGNGNLGEGFKQFIVI